MAAETGFMIDGVECEMPSLGSLNLDEAQVLYDYSGLVVEDFAPAEDAEISADGDYQLDDEQMLKMKNPGFMRALLHVAYQRKHPKMNAAKVKALIGTVNVIDILEQIAQQAGEDDALPPALTTEPEPSSPSDSVESSESSGSGSERSSDGQVVQLTPTTTTGSGTSSTPSPQEASGA